MSGNRVVSLATFVAAASWSLWALGRGVTDTSMSPNVRLRSVPLGDVRWTHGFWSERFALCRDVTIAAIEGALKDPHNAAVLENFRVAAGLAPGAHQGMNWSDGDCYKWLEAVAHVYALTRSEAAGRLLDEWIAVIGKAQAPDGYLSTNVQLKIKKRYANPHHHELYNMGHLLTAACIHHRATGKRTFLEIASKLGDHLHATFGPRPAALAHFGWNPSNIMGLVELYRTTRDPRYLELAGTFVDMRGASPGGTDLTQDRVPLREESEGVGHCVCACYLYCGAADLVAETGDRRLRDALERIWSNVTTRRMYITGAVGSFRNGRSSRGDPVHEAFGVDYELPSRTAYNETCANIANAMWNWRMLGLTGDARYTDVMERVLYNSMLSAIGVDGKGFFYANPLSRDDRKEGLSKHHTALRWSVHGCYCCPPQVARTIAKLQGWAYAVSKEGVWVNLYGGSVLDTRLADGSKIRMAQETRYPWDGKVRVVVDGTEGSVFGVMVRVPSWASGATLAVNREGQAAPLRPGSYATIRRRWAPGDVIELDLPMKVQLMEAHPQVEDLRGWVAVRRGPIVYCLESPDLPDGVRLGRVALPVNPAFTSRFDETLLGGVTVLEGEACVMKATGGEEPLYREVGSGVERRIPIRLIPYYAWANRGVSHMAVWLPAAR